MPWVISPTVDTGHWPLPDLHTAMMRLGMALGEELAGEGVHRGDGERLGHRQVTFEVDARARLVPGLAGCPPGPYLSSVTLLHMPPGDLRFGQSQQLAVQGLELGCLGAAAGD